jgi:hypothetical protein
MASRKRGLNDPFEELRGQRPARLRSEPTSFMRSAIYHGALSLILWLQTRADVTPEVVTGHRFGLVLSRGD